MDTDEAFIRNGSNEPKESKENMEEKYRLLYENMDEGFCIIDVIFDDFGKAVDWRYLETNQQFENQGGLCDAPGKLISEFYPETEDFWFDFYGKVAVSGVPERIEKKFKSINIWYDIYAFKIGGPESRKVGALFRDVTKRKMAEETLMKTDERKTFLLKLSDVLRRISDPVEIEGAVTRSAMGYFGVDRCYYCEIENDKAIIRRDASQSDLPSVVGVYPLSSFPIHKSLLEEGKPFIVHDVHTTDLVDEELRQICIQLKVISYLDVPVVKGGNVVGILCVTQSNPRNWTDLEAELAIEVAERTWAAVEQSRAEEALRRSENHAMELVRELEQADRNKNEFISALSHEFRNPLAAIKSGVALLQLSDSSQKSEKAIDIINRQSEHLSRLVDDLLDVSRITHNKIVLKKERLNLNETVMLAAEDFKEFYVKKEISLCLEICAEPIYIHGDQVRLSQMIDNLLSNTLKFTESGGYVKLSLHRNGNVAFISVEDNGMGIESGLLPYLFIPFTQADKSLDRKNSGLGLGLSIVKGIVELHDGKITASSEGAGKGTRFDIQLPFIVENHDVYDVKQEKDKMAKDFKHQKVLVIEDNKDHAEVICDLIGYLGHYVEYAGTGTEGLSKASEMQPDIIICDIGLPDMNGYEIAGKIRKENGIKDVYLVAYSGYARKQDVELAINSGFDRHLAKPADFDAILSVLNKQVR